VIRRKWFKKEELKYQYYNGTQAEIDHAYNFYKSVFSWLQEDMESTLKSSPFKDYIGLSDFIKSASDKKRTYKALAPVRKGLPFINTITSLISNHYNRCGVLKLKHVERQLESTDSAIKLNAQLLLIANSPYKLDDKISDVMDALRDSKKILDLSNPGQASLFSKLSNQDAALCLMQFAASSISIDTKKFFNFLNLIKKGNLGHFVNKQVFNSNLDMYVGQGLFKGSFDDNPYELEIHDNRLTRIKINSVERFRKYSKLLAEKINELGLTCTNLAFNTPYCFDFVHKTITAPSKGLIKTNQSPIVESLVPPYVVSPGELDFDVDLSGAIRLITLPIRTKTDITVKLIRNRKDAMTIFRFTPSIWRFDSSVLDTKIKEINMMTLWKSNQSISVEDATSLIEQLKTTPELDPSFGPFGDKQKLKNWLKKTLADRVTMKIGLGVQMKKDDVEDTLDVSNILDETENFGATTTKEFNEFNIFDMGFIDEVDRLELEDVQLEKTSEENWDLSNIDLMTHDPSEIQNFLLLEQVKSNTRIATKSTYPITYLSRFWDLVIKYCSSKQWNLSNAVLGTYKERVPEDELCTMISWLSDNDERRERRTHFIRTQTEKRAMF
jgi:hypothetical protein